MTFLAFLALQIAGPVETGTASTRPIRPEKDPARRELLEPYALPAEEFTWEAREIKRNDKIRLLSVSFPSAVRGEIEENNTARAKAWFPVEEAGPTPRPAAVFLHWLGGSFAALELVCRRTAERGIPALLLFLPHYGPRRSGDPDEKRRFLDADLERMGRNLRQAVADVRRARDWLASRPGVDPDRVGLVGISLGAVVGGLAAGVDGHFARCVLIIGGGDLAAIVMHGAKETAELRDALAAQGHTVESLRKLWKGADPCTFAPRLSPGGVLMINAEDDEIIPKASTLALRDAIGEPKIEWFKGGHYGVVYRTGAILKSIVSHLGGESR